MQNTYEHRVVVATHTQSNIRVTEVMNEMSALGYEVHDVQVTNLADRPSTSHLNATSITFRLRG